MSRLGSHALNNQLLWAGVVTGETLVSVEDAMTAVPVAGDLTTFADEARETALATWSAERVLGATVATPFGELPGSVVILFPTIDALAHAWDLSASVSGAFEFPPEIIPAVTDVFEATCTDDARAIGLIQAPTESPTDANGTERLMARSGRAIPR